MRFRLNHPSCKPNRHVGAHLITNFFYAWEISILFQKQTPPTIFVHFYMEWFTTLSYCCHSVFNYIVLQSKQTLWNRNFWGKKNTSTTLNRIESLFSRVVLGIEEFFTTLFWMWTSHSIVAYPIFIYKTMFSELSTIFWRNIKFHCLGELEPKQPIKLHLYTLIPSKHFDCVCF